MATENDNEDEPEPDLVQDYLDSNPANLSKEARQHISDVLRISPGEVNKLIEKFSEDWTGIDPETIPAD